MELVIQVFGLKFVSKLISFHLFHYISTGWAHGIGWIIALIPIGLIIGCAIYQMVIYKYDWVYY